MLFQIRLSACRILIYLALLSIIIGVIRIALTLIEYGHIDYVPFVIRANHIKWEFDMTLMYFMISLLASFTGMILRFNKITISVFFMSLCLNSLSMHYLYEFVN